MKKVIVIGASNSKNSINKQLAVYTASLLNNVEIEVLDLNDFEMPIYNIDKEEVDGVPQLAKDFNDVMATADGFIISFAEHNGAYTTAFKNIFDWVSRINSKMWNSKPVLLMATSPGERGGMTVLEIAKGRMPYHGANVVGSFSLPSFQNHFIEGKMVTTDFKRPLKELVVKLQAAL